MWSNNFSRKSMGRNSTKKILISHEVQNEKFSGKMFPLQASNSSLSDLLILSWKKEILELVNLYLD